MSNAIVANREALGGLAGFLNSKKGYLAAVLPKHLTAERVVKVAITAASRAPQLLRCTPESFALAVIQASQLGLEAGSPLGEAYLVPYGSECTLIVGYRGLIALARRSGEIESIEAHVVHARDRFELSFGLDAKLSHTPHMPVPPTDLDEKGIARWSEEANPGPLVAVYAIARLKGGAVQYEVMTRADVEKIRAKSKAGSTGPWKDHYEEMARKTVVRRLAKYLPMSIEMAQALDLEDRQEHGESLADIAQGVDIQITEGAAAKKASATDKVKAALATQAAKASDDRGDDDPPPTGTDGGGGGAGGDDEGDGADAEGFAAHQARTAGGPQASVRVVREYSDEELVASAKAWDGYLAGCNAWKARNAFRKLSGAFNAEGVFSARERAVVAHLERLPDVKNARAFLYAQPAQKDVDKAA